MADKPATSREAPEPSDHSIKARKQQFFERNEGAGAVTRPFAEYLKSTPPAPLAPGLKAALWGVGALIVLLLAAALLGGRSKAPRGQRTGVLPAAPGPLRV